VTDGACGLVRKDRRIVLKRKGIIGHPNEKAGGPGGGNYLKIRVGGGGLATSAAWRRQGGFHRVVPSREKTKRLRQERNSKIADL